jgi:hypothetical protein
MQKIIKNQKNLFTTINVNVLSNSQYDLKESCFDPSKSSPPNNFMLKLKLRMSVYDTDNKNERMLSKE